MNILITADYKAKNSGNFIGSIIALTRVLINKGDHVFYVFPKVEYEYPWASWLEKESGTSLEYFSYEQARSFDNVNKILQDKKIDLVHDHFSLFRHVLLNYAKDFRNVKMLIHDHMGFTNNKPTIRESVKNGLVGFYCRNNSIGIASVLKTKDKSYWPAGKLHWYIPNGLSLERNLLQSKSRKDCREALGIGENDQMCLLLGWDFHRKGVDIAINAMEKVRKTNPNAILGLVGSGTYPSNQLKEFIKSTTKVDPMCGWIRYLESTEDIFSYFRAADIYISSSRAEGFPYSVLEAISQDTPCVLSNIDSQAWAKEYTNSAVFKNEDVDSCAQAIIDAFSFSRNTNKESIIQTYSVDNWTRKIVEIYSLI